MERLIVFADWLGSTSLSTLLTGHAWIVPNLQVVHILAIAAVVIGAVLINLRALGLIDRDRPLAEYLNRFLPVLGVAIGVLAITGILLIASEPGRALFRTVFWAKLALATVAFAFTWAQRPLLVSGDRAAIARPVLALLSFAAWTAVIFAGRWIAYADAWPGAPA